MDAGPVARLLAWPKSQLFQGTGAAALVGQGPAMRMMPTEGYMS